MHICLVVTKVRMSQTRFVRSFHDVFETNVYKADCVRPSVRLSIPLRLLWWRTWRLS